MSYASDHVFGFPVDRAEIKLNREIKDKENFYVIVSGLRCKVNVLNPCEQVFENILYEMMGLVHEIIVKGKRSITPNQK